MPDHLVGFLAEHADAPVAQLSATNFERMADEDRHPELRAHPAAPIILELDPENRNLALHCIKSAYLGTPSHVALEIEGEPMTMSALHVRSADAIVLVFTDVGLGDPAAVSAADRQRVLSVACGLAGEILWADDAFLETVEATLDDVVGQSLLDFLGDDDVDAALQSWMDAIATGMATRRLAFGRPGHADRWYQATTRVDGDRATVLFVDVTDDVRAAELAEERERDIRRLAETVPLGIFRATADGSLLFQNSRLREVLGMEVRDLDTLPLDRVRTLDGRPVVGAVAGLLAEHDEAQLEVSLQLEEGVRYLRLRARGFEDADGSTQVVGSVEDITADLERSEKLRRDALTDPVTGMGNRRALENELEELLEAEPHRPFAILLIDLDGFKQVNDSLGHDAGDTVIADVGRRLRSVCRSTDTLTRLGGDEFVVVCHEIDDDGTVMELAERLLPALRKPYVYKDSPLELSASIGVARSRPDLSVLGLLQMADHAMYEAKRAGRNQVKAYHSPGRTGRLSPLALRRDLRRAMKADELDLVFQPIFTLDDYRAFSGAEALLRWNHPSQGFIAPGVIIPVAEQSGLIRGLGEWIISHSIESAARSSNLRVSVNISAIQLGRRDFADWVSRQIEEYAIDPDRLIFELTESYLVDQVDHARKSLYRLYDLGITLAVDDFGTGFSTFEYLLSLPVSAVKIDPTFTHKLHEPRAAALLRGLSSACRELGMSVVVEGVESEEHFEAARRTGATHAQGFHLASPAPIDELMPPGELAA